MDKMFCDKLTSCLEREGFSNGYFSTKGELLYEITWGDWKHDHLRLVETINNFCFENYVLYSFRKEVEEEDGSDSYSASYYFHFEPSRFDFYFENLDV